MLVCYVDDLTYFSFGSTGGSAHSYSLLQSSGVTSILLEMSGRSHRSTNEDVKTQIPLAPCWDLWRMISTLAFPVQWSQTWITAESMIFLALSPFLVSFPGHFKPFSWNFPINVKESLAQLLHLGNLPKARAAREPGGNLIGDKSSGLFRETVTNLFS